MTMRKQNMVRAMVNQMYDTDYAPIVEESKSVRGYYSNMQSISRDNNKLYGFYSRSGGVAYSQHMTDKEVERHLSRH